MKLRLLLAVASIVLSAFMTFDNGHAAFDGSSYFAVRR